MMKKILTAFLLCFLIGCSHPRYTLYIYYAKTCPICQSLIDNVIPELEKEYGNQMEIVYFDIDEESSIDAYARTCSLLKDYRINDQSGDVPFIVLDGYFAKIGYQIDQKDTMIQVIKDHINGKNISVQLDNYYVFQDGKSFR